MPGKRSSPVRDYMSKLPHELDRRDTVGRARRVMAESGIHHLPILDGAKLYGVISARDVPLERVDDDTLLGDICELDVYTVPPTKPIAEVARRMLTRRIGSAIVVDAGLVIGIVTNVDVMTAFVHAFT